MTPARASVFALALLTMGQAQPLPRPEPAPPAPAERRAAARFEQIRADPVALRAFLLAFPKGADLHTHLSGAVYAESYIEWAAEMGLCIDLATSTFVDAAEPSAATPVCRDSAAQRPATDALADPLLYRTLVDAMSMRNHGPSRGPGAYHFFDSFTKFQAVVRSRLPGSERIAGESLAELVQRAARQHVQHVEVIVGLFDGLPTDLARQTPWKGPDDLAGYRERLLAAGARDSVPARRAWLDSAEATLRARLGCGTSGEQPGCRVSRRYITYVLRTRPPQEVFAQMLFAFELAAADPRVVAVNPVQPEDDHVALRDFELHLRMFELMHRVYPNVGITLHAGELAFGQVPPRELGWHVRRAVESGVTRRIGHGADVMHDPGLANLLGEMARRRIAVEVSLSSSDHILGLRGPEHPLRHYLRAGVPVIVCTDDEGVSRTDLTHEYQRAVEEHGVTYAELKRISRDGIEHSFLPDEEKRRLRSQLEEALAAFERSFH